MAGAANDLVNKGGLTEMVAGWEMVKHASPKTQHDLYYWQNLNKSTTSEVDYLHHAILTSLEYFGTIEYTDSEDAGAVRRIDIVPLYALDNV